MLSFQDADQSSKFFYENATTVVPVVLGKYHVVLSQRDAQNVDVIISFCVSPVKILTDYISLFTRVYKN